MAIDLTGKMALITGASSGIGTATARIFAKNGINLVLAGRRTDRLEAIANELSNLVKVHTVAFDISDRQAVANAVDSLPLPFKNVDILINNAGNAHGLETIQEANIDDWDAMIGSNVRGLLYISRALLPNMIANGYGHVVNIGSIASVEVYPKGGVYCATKHAVHAISEGMRHDLLGTGVRVTDLKPGMTDTEFSLVRFKGDADRAAKVYQGLEPLHAEDLADAIYYSITRPLHVQVADIMLLPVAQASIMNVLRN